MPDAKFESHIRTTAWYKVLSETAKEDDESASVFRMARMAAQEAWSAAGREAAEQIDTLTTELAGARAAIDVYHARVVEMGPDAARYLAFFNAGLPITFMGIDYFDKASLDAAIDAALAATKEQG